MSDVPECLQPAVEQLQKYETKISVLENKNKNLDDDIQSLLDEKSKLNDQILEEAQAHSHAVEEFEKEKTTLRELNLVVSDQLRAKSEELEALEASNKQLSELNSRVSSESIRVNAGQEALSHQSQRLSQELESLRMENNALKEENTSLKLVNETDISSYQNIPEDEEDVSNLLAEIKRLKKEVLSKGTQTDPQEGSFLERENERLMQRHGEITQEKMQASAKMHAAVKELEETQEKLSAANKHIEQLESEVRRLQELHNTLTQEKDILIEDNLVLIDEKTDLDARVMRLSEEIQRVTSQRDEIERSLTQEHIVEDSLTDEVNHLRAKSRRLAEEVKLLREGQHINTDLGASGTETFENDAERPEIDIVVPNPASGPHFPGEGDNNAK